MTYSDVTAPTWANAEQTAISCRVKFDAFDAPMPFTAMSNDSEAYGRQLFDECAAGQHGEVVPYIAPVPDVPPDSHLKDRLVKEAEAVIQVLERAVKYDMATDEEKSRLEAWERYSVLLSRVDVEKPDWPENPSLSLTD